MRVWGMKSMTTHQKRPANWVLLAGLALIGLLVAIGMRSCGGHPARIVYNPTPENEANLKRIVDGALTFTVLHEAGHMMVSELNLLVLGHEEDAADGFAVFILSDEDPKLPPNSENHTAQEEALAGGAIFFDGLYQQERLNKSETNWADEHGQPEQRAFTITCLLVGMDPKRFADIAQASKLPPDRLERCPAEAANNRTNWINVLDPALERAKANSGGPARIGVHYRPISPDLSEPLRSRLVRDRDRLMESHALSNVASIMSVVPLKPFSFMMRPQLNLNDSDALARSARIQLHGPTEPGDEAFVETYEDYRVVGDPCLDKAGNPIANAFWNAEARTIFVCYALVELVEDIGKTDLAIATSK